MLVVAVSQLSSATIGKNNLPRYYKTIFEAPSIGPDHSQSSIYARFISEVFTLIFTFSLCHGCYHSRLALCVVGIDNEQLPGHTLMIVFKFASRNS
jgi:hypothetical protein